MREGVSARIRAWLAAQDGPRTSRQMAEGIGVDALKVQHAVGVMLRDGMLDRVTLRKPATYVLLRERMTPHEVSLRAAEGRRRANAREDRRREREVRKQAAADKRRQERVEALRRELAERRKPHRAGPGIQVIAKREAPIRADRVQTVDEWLAAGGQIQRLAQHEMSPGWRARW